MTVKEELFKKYFNDMTEKIKQKSIGELINLSQEFEYIIFEAKARKHAVDAELANRNKVKVG